ncbi:MAG: hypothetical protein IJ867_00190 [Clostridia bacterium]|nr:hypothetical protein [Clostridia bacterium]
MLVLAGVSINALVGDNGIITNAQQSKIASEDAAWKETAELIATGTLVNIDEITLLTDEELATCARQSNQNS